MNVYIGTFLIAFATLALEITLARLLSVSTWYYLAFFAIMVKGILKKQGINYDASDNAVGH